MLIRIRHLRGVKDLLEDVVTATVNVSESLQQKIARQPYALLQRIDVIASPVRKIESVQAAITQKIYGTIRLVTRGSAGLASRLLDLAEQNERRQK